MFGKRLAGECTALAPARVINKGTNRPSALGVYCKPTRNLSHFDARKHRSTLIRTSAVGCGFATSNCYARTRQHLPDVVIRFLQYGTITGSVSTLNQGTKCGLEINTHNAFWRSMWRWIVASMCTKRDWRGGELHGGSLRPHVQLYRRE